MSTQEIKSAVSGYLARFFPGHPLGEDEDIFSLGFVNSLFAMQLVSFIEHGFGVTVENEDLDLDNFRTIEAISRLVERKVTATSGGGE